MSEAGNKRDFTQDYFEQDTTWHDHIHPYQDQVLADLARAIPNGADSILDLGCGDGQLTNRLLPDRFVVGVDRSAQAIASVTRPRVRSDATRLPFADRSFHTVVSNDVLEHLNSSIRAQAVEEIARVAAQCVVITVPYAEDLNAGSVRCAQCGSFYHVNHHLSRFDLETTRNLLGGLGFRCTRQILTGAEWGHLAPEIEYARRVLGVDYPLAESPLCPHCGSRQLCEPSAAGLANPIDRLSATLAACDRGAAEQGTLRTEVMSIFLREGFEEALLPPAAQVGIALNAAGQPVTLERVALDTGALDLGLPSLFVRSFLPSSGLLPYLLDTGAGVAPGTLVSGEHRLIGFFKRPSSEGERPLLMLSGEAAGETTIEVSSYADDGNFVVDASIAVHGAFDIEVAVPRADLGRYGCLFRVAAGEGAGLELRRVALGPSPGETIDCFLNPRAAAPYLVVSLQPQVLLSLAHYGEQVIPPAWAFESADGPHRPPTLLDPRNELPASAASSIALLLLRRIAAIPRSDLLARAAEAAIQSFIDVPAADPPGAAQPVQEPVSRRRWRWLVQLLGGSYVTYWAHRDQILEGTGPSLRHPVWREETDARRRFLMICHDQDIDRRILNEAQELCAVGWRGMIVALSQDGEDHVEGGDPLLIHRIGLSRIVPDCPVYWTMSNRERKIAMLGPWGRFLHRVNWQWYRLSLRRTYRSKSIAYPLPFDECFLRAARQYPADLVFAHDLPALKAACEVAERWDAPVIYDSHELYSEQAAFSEHQRHILDERERDYAPRCARIMTVSRSFAEVIARKNKVEAPEIILNAYTDYSPPPERPTLLRDAVKLSPKERIILYQGVISNHRNLSNLVSGFLLADPADAHLVFLGPAMPEILAALRRRAGADLGRRIHFLDPVPQDALLDYTTSADFGVIPYPPVDLNTRYCMPNKLFEYIQAELPVLANDLHEVGRIMQELDGGGLSKDLNTAEGMADGIRAMLARDLESDRQALAAAKYRFTWSHERVHFLSIVDAVMSHSGHGGADGS
jgi:SAM-dependent methyltransferase